MRTKARTELPGPLRRLQNLRPKDLSRHSAVLLVALEDEVLRARIVEWLDDAPAGIRKDDAALLRAAAERSEGWEDAIKEKEAAPPPLRDTAASSRDATAAARIERERQRVAKARAAEDRARSDLQIARREIAALRKEIDALRAQLEAVRSGEEEVRASTYKERARSERELRKARKATEEAQEERKALRKELLEARREIARMRTEEDGAKPRRPRVRDRPAPTTRAAPQRRTPLRVPKGRLADAPETLSAWLDVDYVTLVVDGYNVTKSEAGFGDLELETQRDRLVDGLGRLARRTGVPTIVVFDGAEGPVGSRPRRRGPVKVEYSRPNEIADDHIVARVADLPNRPVVVVTGDRELQERARAEGATIATSAQLLALLR